MSDIKLAIHPFTVRRGDTFRKTIKILNNSYDLTNHILRMKVVKKDGTPVLSFSTGDGSITLTDGKEFQLFKSALQMQVEPGCHRYDLEVETPAGDVTTWLEGPFTVLKDITS